MYGNPLSKDLKIQKLVEPCHMRISGRNTDWLNENYLDGKSRKTTFFYTENQAIAPTSNYEKQIPSDYYLSCVEDTIASVTNLRSVPEMFKKYPKFESLTLVFMGQDYSQTKESFAKFKTSSPEDRYLHLLENRPDLLQRVPQLHIASYIGVTPESLSRIRKRVSKKASK